MAQMTNDELLQKLQEHARARRREDRLVIELSENPEAFGRRIARETFKEYPQTSHDRASGESNSG